VLLASGKVLVAGGVGTGYSFLSSAELYDPASGTFAPTGSMTTPRESHTATLLRNGKVLVTGGHKDRREAMTVFASAELYDPESGRFTATGNMARARHKHGATLLADGSVLIVGGSDNRDWQGQYDTAEIYDAGRGTFRAAGTMSSARFKLAGAVVTLANGRALVAGGAAAIEVYDAATDRWFTVDGQIDTARFFAAATPLRDGRVLITGGYDERGVATARAWIYDGSDASKLRAAFP
jgi:N-acetylneuraminic acid mutarotase